MIKILDTVTLTEEVLEHKLWRGDIAPESESCTMAETKYDVVLVTLKDRARIMKAIMSVNPIGLKRSKEIADNPPGVVLSGVSNERALEVQEILENAGGTVEIRPASE